MKRRALISSLSVLALAGCTGGGPNGSGGVGHAYVPNFQLKMDAISNADIPAHLGLTVTTDQVPQLLPEVVENGSATVTERTEPISANRTISYNGTVYTLSNDVTGHTPATRYTLKFSSVSSTPNSDKTIQYDSLPKVDQSKLTEIPPAGTATVLTYIDSEQSKSALVPSPTKPIVERGNHVVRITVTGQTSVTLTTYHYSATKIGTDAQYGEQMNKKYGFTLSNLSSKETSIISKAIQSKQGYTVAHGHAIPDAVQSLMNRFRSHNSLPIQYATGNYAYLVTYQDTMYWARLVIITGTSTG